MSLSIWRLSKVARLAALPEVLVRWRSGNNISSIHSREQLRTAFDISVRILGEVMESQALDEESYRRFWAALLADDLEASMKMVWLYWSENPIEVLSLAMGW